MSIMDPAALPLAKKVLHKITTERAWFDMSGWFGIDTREIDGVNVCDTTACLAGWAMILSGECKLNDEGLPIDIGGFEEAGARLLGLPIEEVADTVDEDGIQWGRKLFYTDEDDALDRLTGLIAEAEAEQLITELAEVELAPA